MPVQPTDIAIDVNRETLPRKPHCSKRFCRTIASLIFSTPILIWVFTILCRMIAQSGQEPFCDRLLKADHTGEAVLAIALIMGFILTYIMIAFPIRNWYATVALVLAFSTSISVLAGFYNVSDKTSLGIFHNRSPSTMFGGNTSEYWKNNFKSCVCETEGCEDYVYRNYLVNFYLDRRQKRVIDLSGYERFSPEDEAKRIIPPVQDLNGTSLKNGDRSSPSSISGYHEVCYSKNLGDKGKKTLCYSCYACEEKRLRSMLRNRWKSGNQLFIISFLFIASDLIVFLAELWARYMDTG